MIADRFFQAAFGGSFLNHQWLVAAATPDLARRATAAHDQHAIVDSNGMPTNYPLYTRDRAGARRTGADAGVPAPATAARCLRRLRGQHDPADLPALPPAAGRRQLPPQTGADDRRPAEREGRRLGVVLGRLVERRRRRRRAGLDQRHRRRRLLGPGHGRRRRRTRTARTSCSSSTTSRSTTTRLRARAPPPAPRTCATRRSSTSPRPRAALPLKPVSFIKPIGAENEHPGYASEHAAATTSSTCSGRSRRRLREGHDGHRDLRRVRRPVGPRVAARPGRRRRAPHDRSGPARASRR